MQKDYAGAAIFKKQLKEDAMPHRSEGDDCPARALLARRIQALEQRLRDRLQHKDYEGAAALQEEIESISKPDTARAAIAARKQDLEQRLKDALEQQDYARAATLQAELDKERRRWAHAQRVHRQQDVWAPR